MIKEGFSDLLFLVKKVSFAAKYFPYLIRKGQFRTVYNYLWLYLFYWSNFGGFLLTKVFPFFGIEFYPPFIEIETTTKCNLKCIMCEHTYWKEPGIDMSFEDFKKIIDQIPSLKWVGLTGIGESFLNKDFMRMIRYLKQKKINIYNLYDPFLNLNEKIIGELIDLGVDHVYISMDAATKETYEKIRVGANFDRVVKNIKTLGRLKKEKRSLLPIIVFHYIVSKANVHEMVKYLELIHSIDIDVYEVVFSPLLHVYSEVEDLSIKIHEETIAEVQKRAKELGLSVEAEQWSSRALTQKKPPVSKCIQWIMPFIFVTGHVILCCTGNEANNREFQKRYGMGNVFEQDFKDIWRGKKFKAVRKLLCECKVPIQCRNCATYDLTPKV